MQEKFFIIKFILRYFILKFHLTLRGLSMQKKRLFEGKEKL